MDSGPFVSTDPIEPTGPGALDGWDIAVKDMIAIAGRPSSAGLVPPLIEVADADAPVVVSLRAAGARLVGVTRMHQLACGITGVNDNQGTPSNPRWPDRIPGGSSSGSAAAVAAGTVRAAIGTDTGGSVRIPAACCAVVGVKPHRGAIPLDGIVPCAPSLDHVGVFARTVDDAMTVLRVLGVPIGAVPPTDVIGVDRAALAAATPEVRIAMLAALDGRDIVEIDLPDPARVARTSTTVLLGEFARVHVGLSDVHRAALGPDIVERLERGAAISDADLDRARGDLVALEAEVRSVLETVPVIALPTLPAPAPLIETARQDPTATGALLVSNTRLANCTGLPAMSVPLDSEVPIGLQLIAADLGVLAGEVGL